MTRAMDGHNGRLITRSKRNFFGCFPDERRHFSDDGLEKSMARRVEATRVLVLGRDKTAHRLEIDDQIRLPDEHQPVLTAKNGCRRDGRDELPFPFDLDKKDALKVAKTTVLDRLSIERATLLHQHVQNELAELLIEIAARTAALRDEKRRQSDDDEKSHDGDGNTDRCHLEHTERLFS